MLGDFPPSSSATGTTFAAAACATSVPDLTRSGERDVVDPGMGAERGTGLVPKARDDVQDARREPCLDRQFPETQRRQRGLLGRLDDAAVTGRQ